MTTKSELKFESWTKDNVTTLQYDQWPAHRRLQMDYSTNEANNNVILKVYDLKEIGFPCIGELTKTRKEAHKIREHFVRKGVLPNPL